MKRFLHDDTKITHVFDVLPNSRTLTPVGVFQFDAPSLDPATWPEDKRSLLLYITTGQKQRYHFMQASNALKAKWSPLLPGIAALNDEGKETEAKTVIAALVPSNAEETALRELFLSL